MVAVVMGVDDDSRRRRTDLARRAPPSPGSASRRTGCRPPGRGRRRSGPSSTSRYRRAAARTRRRVRSAEGVARAQPNQAVGCQPSTRWSSRPSAMYSGNAPISMGGRAPSASPRGRVHAARGSTRPPPQGKASQRWRGRTPAMPTSDTSSSGTSAKRRMQRCGKVGTGAQQCVEQAVADARLRSRTACRRLPGSGRRRPDRARGARRR